MSAVVDRLVQPNFVYPTSAEETSAKAITDQPPAAVLALPKKTKPPSRLLGLINSVDLGRVNPIHFGSFTQKALNAVKSACANSNSTTTSEKAEFPPLGSIKTHRECCNELIKANAFLKSKVSSLSYALTHEIDKSQQNALVHDFQIVLEVRKNVQKIIDTFMTGSLPLDPEFKAAPGLDNLQAQKAKRDFAEKQHTEMVSSFEKAHQEFQKLELSLNHVTFLLSHNLEVPAEKLKLAEKKSATTCTPALELFTKHPAIFSTVASIPCVYYYPSMFTIIPASIAACSISFDQKLDKITEDVFNTSTKIAKNIASDYFKNSFFIGLLIGGTLFFSGETKPIMPVLYAHSALSVGNLIHANAGYTITQMRPLLKSVSSGILQATGKYFENGIKTGVPAALITAAATRSIELSAVTYLGHVVAATLIRFAQMD